MSAFTVEYSNRDRSRDPSCSFQAPNPLHSKAAECPLMRQLTSFRRLVCQPRNSPSISESYTVTSSEFKRRLWRESRRRGSPYCGSTGSIVAVMNIVGDINVGRMHEEIIGMIGRHCLSLILRQFQSVSIASESSTCSRSIFSMSRNIFGASIRGCFMRTSSAYQMAARAPGAKRPPSSTTCLACQKGYFCLQRGSLGR